MSLVSAENPTEMCSGNSNAGSCRFNAWESLDIFPLQAVLSYFYLQALRP